MILQVRIHSEDADHAADPEGTKLADAPPHHSPPRRRCLQLWLCPKIVKYVSRVKNGFQLSTRSKLVFGYNSIWFIVYYDAMF